MALTFSQGRRHVSLFFMKVTFYDPRIDPESKGKNAAHVQYISHRKGVDKGQLEPEQKVQLDQLAVGVAEHVRYAHYRPRSHGLFGPDEIPPNVQEIQNELKSHNGLAWRFVLSLNETDAVRLGMTNRAAWERAIRASIGAAAEQMNIGETNLRWVAAFHDEPGHPHVHLIMWEKDPQRKRGKLSRHEYRKVKREFMREIYARERMFLNTEKTMMRDIMRTMAKESVLDKLDFIRDVRKEMENVQLLNDLGGLTPNEYGLPRIHAYQQDQFAQYLDEISHLLPGQGRIAYQYMPSEVKQKLDEVAGWIIQQPQFKEYRERYFAAVRSMTQLYTGSDEALQKALRNAESDLKKRLAQVVLRGAVELQKNVSLRVDPDKAAEVIRAFESAEQSYWDPMAYRVVQHQLHILGSFQFTYEEQKRIMLALAERANYGLDKQSMERIVDQLHQQVSQRFDQFGDAKLLVGLLKYAGYSQSEIQSILKEKGIQLPERETVFHQVDSILEQNGRSNTSQDQAIHQHDQTNEKKLDLQYFAKEYGIKDEAYQFIRKYALVLYAAGLDKEQVREFIDSWKQRSESQIDDAKIDRAIEMAEKYVNDVRDWKRDPVMGKSEFRQLCDTLGIQDVPWMWRSDHEFKRVENQYKENVVAYTLGHIGDAFAQELKQQEAKAEFERQKMIRNIQRQEELEERRKKKNHER